MKIIERVITLYVEQKVSNHSTVSASFKKQIWTWILELLEASMLLFSNSVDLNFIE